jgi:hypothetical protein
MFFSKKKTKKACAEAAEQFLIQMKTAQAEALIKLDQEISLAAEIPDAGEKLLKLEELQRSLRGSIINIDEGITSFSKKIEDELEKKIHRRSGTGAFGGLVGFVGGLIAAAVTGGSAIPVIPFVIAAAGGTSVMGSVLFLNIDRASADKIIKATEEQLKASAQEFKNALSARHGAVIQTIDDILQGPLEPLSCSLKFDDLMTQYPSLKDRFFNAALRKGLLPQLPQPKPPGNIRRFNP